jgi:hypothetical protein
MSARTLHRRGEAPSQGWLDRERALTLALIAAALGRRCDRANR